MEQKIAVVVPTNRPEKLEKFLTEWDRQFKKYEVTLYMVHDGEHPILSVEKYKENGVSATLLFHVVDIMGDRAPLLVNFNDGVRNLGFAQAYKDNMDIIISLDDDTAPYGDTIGDHLKALSKRYPISWMNTANETYMRGFPYNLREEAECVLSHGVWQGVPDLDASTQLVLGVHQPTYPKMPIPKGILFPMCIMNVAFKRCMVPYMYQAPMLCGVNRFADIWGGIEAKKAIDEKGWAAVTGYATVKHDRASDPFVNLVKEAKGVGMNEKYGEDDYFKIFQNNISLWRKFLEA